MRDTVRLGLRACTRRGAGFSRFLQLVPGEGESQTTGKLCVLHRSWYERSSGQRNLGAVSRRDRFEGQSVRARGALCARAASRCSQEYTRVRRRMDNQMTISNQTVERCIEECLQCLRWCGQCRAESLNEDPIMTRDCIRLCNECIELCRTCVAMLTGCSGFAHLVCGICSELCTACASECGKYAGETMRKCAQACRQCAATCAEVAKAGPIRHPAAAAWDLSAC